MKREVITESLMDSNMNSDINFTILTNHSSTPSFLSAHIKTTLGN